MLTFSIFLIVLSKVAFCEELFYNINTNKVLHKVSEKFLSISIDPAVLLAGANLSDVSLLLARHLSPAYIRLAGPSTPFVKYIDNEDDPIIRKSEEGTNVIITPAMWFGINEWFNLANLTPVFGINDDETDKGVWDPKSTLPLLEMSDKFGVTCYWQLGYDCSNKTTIQYIEDLNILRQTLNGFPEHNDTWKIVGSDLSRCNFDKLDIHNFDSYVSDLDENIDAVMWESFLIPKSELGFSKSAVWTSVPKDPKPVTFFSAMEWAKQVGEAAKMEYDVIFRLPRLLEMTHDTPVYWFSFLHKKLMGNNVLEVRPTNPSLDLLTYAHCTKRQNNFVRTGAITIMVINNGSESNNVNIRLGNFMLDKSMEVQSYILTAPDESSTEVYLNDQKLTMDMLRKSDNILRPKLRRAKIIGHLSLEVPSLTVGFFVLTGAKNTLCSNTEQDLNSILADINGDQNLSLSEETHFTIEDRLHNGQKADTSKIVGEKVTLDAIKKNILKEMELDKHYYNKMVKKHDSDGRKESSREKAIDGRKETLHKHLREFIEKAKKSDASDSGAKRQKVKSTPVSHTLHFTIKEIEDILKNRAKAKAAAKNVKLTSSELDMLVDKATIRLPKHFISKRDINALLLEEKANFHKNNMFSQETYEQRAKQRKWFPAHKFRRSQPAYSRTRRNINKKLLNLKAKIEEHKKYMHARSSHLRNSLNQKHKSIFSRTKRDINLDLLRKRTKPDSSHKIAVQPNLKSYKGYFSDVDDDDDGDEGKYATKMLPGEISDELLSDFLESDEEAIADTKKYSKLFAENSDMDLFDFEDYFKEPKSKHKMNLHDFISQPKFNTASARKSTPKKKDKSAGFDYQDYLQLLGSLNEFDNFDEEVHQPCSRDWGFMSESPIEMESSKLSELWQLRSPQTGKYKKEKSAVTDLDDLIFPGDFEFGFLRKKRGTNSIAKEKLTSLTYDIKSEVNKLREQIAEDKVKYIREKIKNKMELRRQKQIEKLKRKGFVKASTNIQIVPKTVKKDENYYNIKDSSHIIDLSANEAKNVKSKFTDNKVKRSLMNNNLNSVFGQYQPLTNGLRPWKPMDILRLQNPLLATPFLATPFLANPFLATLPLYTMLQTQALNNMLRPGHIGLRRRRYIDDGSINSMENAILSDEELQIDRDRQGKTQFVKYSEQDLERKNKLLQKTSNLETTIKFDSNDTTPITIKANPTQDDSVGKIVPGEKMSKLKRKDIIKYSKENQIVNKTNNLEMGKLNIDNTMSKTIRNQSTHSNFVDKIISGKNMSYLETILGKKKVEPFENFAETFKNTINNINKNVKDFFKSIF